MQGTDALGKTAGILELLETAYGFGKLKTTLLSEYWK